MKNIAITLAVICVLMVIGRSEAAVTLKDASTIWLFEENGGDTAKDLTENSNDGEITGKAKWAEGKFGTGLEMTQQDKVGSATANGVGKTFLSECLWVKFDNFTTENQFGYIQGSGTASTRYFYFSSWCAAGPPHDCIHLGTLDLAGAWGRGIVTAPLFKEDRWYYVCGVINNETGNIKAYVDGEQKHSQDFAKGDTLGTPIQIWAGGTPENYQWVQGTIDEVAFFNIALTENDIKSLMNNGVLKAFPVDPKDKLATTWGGLKRQ